MIKHKALTTIELLVATALAAMLMMGVLRAISSIRPQLAGNQHPPAGAWPASVINLLRWDLANARSVRQENNTLTMVGYNALNRGDFGWRQHSDMPSIHQPVIVEYRLWPGQEGGNWLIRRQTHTAEQTNRNAWAEVIAWNIESIVLEPVAGTVGPTIDMADAWLGKAIPVPDRMRLLVQTAGDPHPAIDSLIVVR